MRTFNKGATITFDPNKMLEALFDEFYEVALIGAKRLEQEARMNLQEEIGATLVNGKDGSPGISKSSGALMESIQGFVRAGGKGGIEIGVSASAIETGQWEESVGEPEEAAFTRGAGKTNYARMVEEGTGIFGPNKQAIEKKMVFWGGGGNKEGNKDLTLTPQSEGQPGKFFLRNALKTSMPAIEKLIESVGTNIRVSKFIRWE